MKIIPIGLNLQHEQKRIKVCEANVRNGFRSILKKSIPSSVSNFESEDGGKRSSAVTVDIQHCPDFGNSGMISLCREDNDDDLAMNSES